MAQIIDLSTEHKNNQLLSQTLLNKYNINGPRYTSYPTALEFEQSFSELDFMTAVAQSQQDRLSLYIHIPFCHSLCYYCGFNKIVTRHKHKADIYLDHLEQEIKQRSTLFKEHKVQQVVSASAIGIYPDSLTNYYDQSHNEVSDSFLGQVVSVWEQAVNEFSKLNITVSKIRIGLVLSNKGGALVEIVKPIKFGLGAAFGSGKQWQSILRLSLLCQ